MTQDCISAALEKRSEYQGMTCGNYCFLNDESANGFSTSAIVVLSRDRVDKNKFMLIYVSYFCMRSLLKVYFSGPRYFSSYDGERPEKIE